MEDLVEDGPTVKGIIVVYDEWMSTGDYLVDLPMGDHG